MLYVENWLVKRAFPTYTICVNGRFANIQLEKQRFWYACRNASRHKEESSMGKAFLQQAWRRIRWKISVVPRGVPTEFFFANPNEIRSSKRIFFAKSYWLPIFLMYFSTVFADFQGVRGRRKPLHSSQLGGWGAWLGAVSRKLGKEKLIKPCKLVTNIINKNVYSCLWSICHFYC